MLNQQLMLIPVYLIRGFTTPHESTTSTLLQPHDQFVMNYKLGEWIILKTQPDKP